MLRCEVCKDDRCILRQVGEWYERAVRIQVEAYEMGVVGKHPTLEQLGMLHGYSRWCLCPLTATLPPDMLPDMQPLLKAVPAPHRRAVRFYINRAWSRHLEKQPKDIDIADTGELEG